MREYILSLLATVTVASIAVFFIPSNPSSNIGKHIRSILALSVICIIIFPISSFIENISKIGSFSSEDIKDEEYELYFSEYLALKSESMAKNLLYELLSSEFSVPREDVEIYVSVFESAECFEINKVTVVLSGFSITKNPYEIEERISNLLNCECITAIE